MSHKEVLVGKTTDLAAGEMKQVSANGVDILLACVGGNFHAVGAHCTHYGAPLVEGVLNGERIVCPWHHACFNVTTGNLHEPPALDALPTYELKIRDDQIIVHVPDDAPDRRTPRMSRRDLKDERLFVIAGGGAAGYVAAQTLREDGFTGRIVLITRENNLPYDRPNLSKDYLQGTAQPEWLPLRSEEYFAEHDIELIRGREIARIDAADRKIIFADGTVLHGDALLLATGGEPRTLPFQSDAQKNVVVLRSHADADAIIAAAKEEQRVVVIGASFIGMEVAASLRGRGCEVTVAAPDHVPFEKNLGPEIGKLFQQVHEENGVTFKLGTSVSGFVGAEKVTAVLLENGERLDADLVVVGVGVKPATHFVHGLNLHPDGGVIVDQYMRAADRVYAAGDIAYFPNPISRQLQRTEHWRTAMQQGRIAAHNMPGRQIPYEGVPFFWTRQFGVGLLYVGHAKRWDEIIYQGNVAHRDFLAFYIKDGVVLAVAGMNRDQEMAAIEELMRLNRMPSRSQLEDHPTGLLQLLNSAEKEAEDHQPSLTSWPPTKTSANEQMFT
jgi:NADPH-dependent 2,4-dienoyl-CoA reductase/sulfur reductase-like enzyme/nitrite reductase/ring-hydroxylating ferredoxin subunit